MEDEFLQMQTELSATAKEGCSRIGRAQASYADGPEFDSRSSQTNNLQNW